jgi:hypothetical protein
MHDADAAEAVAREDIRAQDEAAALLRSYRDGALTAGELHVRVAIWIAPGAREAALLRALAPAELAALRAWFADLDAGDYLVTGQGRLELPAAARLVFAAWPPPAGAPDSAWRAVLYRVRAAMRRPGAAR